jgi:NADH:ubiquinone oxidoreductase subunit F (NADH-binding)/NADH:ubiquinone oxidoreductase subunit E
VQPSLPPGSEKPYDVATTPASGPAVFGEKGRAVDEAIAKRRSEPASLVSLLVELYRLLGPLAPPAIDYVALRLRLPQEAIASLANAYKVADPNVSVPRLGLCINGPCAARGGAEVERILKEKGVPFEPLRCQGSCDLGPIACYHHGAPLAISAARARSLAKADPGDWEDLLAVEKPVHAFKTEPRAAFTNIFAKGSHQLATARRHGVYAPLEAAVREPPEKVLAAIEDAGLLGAGGFGEKTADRWRKARQASGSPRYLLIDAAEREPGSFKDRILLERDPHLVLSGAALAAYAVGATEAFLCLRLEYELAQERLRAAIEEAFRAGYLGERVAGSDSFSLRLDIRLVAPPYFAGEAGALVDALEGKPPRSAPAPVALFGQPTLVHNVETLARLPSIVGRGGAWWRSLGSGGGLLVCCLSGDLKRPGAYEVARGTPIRDLIDGLGGGPAQGKLVTGAQIGGSSGAYLPASLLDLPLDDAALAPHGAFVGIGSVMAFTEKTCVLDLARREAAFFARESTPGCPACRLLTGVAQKIDETGNLDELRASVEEIEVAARAGGCALSLRAVVPIASLLRHFSAAAADHAEGRCSCALKKKPR